MLLLVQGLCAAEPAVTTEYQLKAAFLFNFLQFVDWPTSAFDTPERPVSICVLGPDPFGPELDAVVAGEHINGRAVEVRRLDSVEGSDGCHLLFVNVHATQELHKIIEYLKGRPMLTVSDVTAFSTQGGMIEFVTQNDRIRLRVNLRAASEAQLRLSSKLLRRSEIVAPARA